jgi:hypothetical protein
MRKIILFLLLLIASRAGAQVIPFMIKYPSTSTGSVTVQFRATTASPTTGVDAVMFGAPHTAVVSYTNTTYGVTISSVATANWSSYSGCTCTSQDAISGSTGGSYISGVGSSAYSSGWFNYGATVANFNSSKDQFEITGLPNQPITLQMTGHDGTLGFDDNPIRFKATGGTVVTGGNNSTGQVAGVNQVDVNGDVASQSDGAKIILYPDGTGKIKLYVNTVSGEANTSDLAYINVLKISW